MLRIVSTDKGIEITSAMENIHGFGEKDYYDIIHRLFMEDYQEISRIKSLPSIPISRRFGLEHGKPIDRYYIESFLNSNSHYIKGDVLEVAENIYTNMFGEEDVRSKVLHVNGWGGMDVIKGNLETGEGIIENTIDCFICTQTIQYIYNIKSTVMNIHKLLKNGGVALITATGITPLSVYDNLTWGEYWHFTKKSLEKSLCEVFEENKVIVETYGNVKTAVAMLYGLCIEDMNEVDFDVNDEQYPVVLSAVCIK